MKGKTRQSKGVITQIGPEGVAELVPGFLESLRDRGLSPATADARSTALNSFLKFLAEEGISRAQDVTPRAFAAFRGYLDGNGMSVNSTETYLNGVRAFFGFLEGEAVIFSNPTRDAPIRQTPPPVPKTISVPDVRRLLNAVSTATPVGLRDRALLEVLYATGVRRAELLALRVRDLDLDQSVARINGKGRKERSVPLGDHAVAALTDYIAQGRPKLLYVDANVCEALWVQRTRRRQSLNRQNLCHIIRKYAELAGIEAHVTTHTLRRSCATHMLVNGANPLFVARMLGHADLSSLKHYLKVDIDDLRNTHRKTNPGK